MKRINSALLAGAALLLVPSAAMAQDVPAAQPAVVEAQAASPMAAEAMLPANTEVVLTMNAAVSSKSHRLGEKFSLTVAQDVKADGMTVIPRGTRAVAQITRRTGKGGFGKSGKMDFTFRYIDLDGRQIPIEGRHHQAGEGRGGAAVAGVVAAGIVGGMLVKGKSAKIEEGREFTARTRRVHSGGHGRQWRGGHRRQLHAGPGHDDDRDRQAAQSPREGRESARQEGEITAPPCGE